MIPADPSFVLRLVISEEAEARIQALIQETNATNEAEVINNALKLYEWMIGETKLGKKYIVKDEYGLQPFYPWELPA